MLQATSVLAATSWAVEAFVALDGYLDEPQAEVVFFIDPDTTGLTASAQLLVSGEEERVSHAPVRHGTATVELPIGGLIPGAYDVELRVYRGDAVVWAGVDRLVQLPPLPPGARRVQIDRVDRILRVDGKPMFPLGVFGVPAGELRSAAAAGFNLTMRWKGETTAQRWDRSQPWTAEANRAAVRTYLDSVHAAGLLALETPVKLAERPLYVRFRDADWAQKWPIINDGITPGIVRQARNHPAVIGYYSYDEPDNFYPTTPDHPKHLLMQQGVESWYRIVKRLDPWHPVWTLFAVGLSKVETWQAWDVVLRDFYIDEDEPLRHVYDHALASARVARHRRSPFVFTPLFESSSGRTLPLTPEQQRAQTYLALAADVKGLLYWDWPLSYAPTWQMMQQLAREIEKLTPVLLEPAPSQNVSTDGEETAIVVLLKNHASSAFLLAVNPHSEAVDARISWKEDAGVPGNVAAAVLFDDRQVAVRGGLLRDRIEGYGRRVYRMDGTWRHGVNLRVSSVPAAVAPEVPSRLADLPRPDSIGLLANGGFEHDHPALPGWPWPWRPEDTVMRSGQVGAEEGLWTPVVDAVLSGRRAMRLTRTVAGTADADAAFGRLTAPAAHQDVVFPAAGRYRLSAWMKSDASDSANVWLMAGWEDRASVRVGQQWVHREFTFARTSPGRGFVRIYLRSQGRLWIDDVSLERLEASKVGE